MITVQIPFNKECVRPMNRGLPPSSWLQQRQERPSVHVRGRLHPTHVEEGWSQVYVQDYVIHTVVENRE